ncbi:MAG: maleylpyruvate isomerase N-terminal domain-containing protein [Acidimicrobiales bacterium]
MTYTDRAAVVEAFAEAADALVDLVSRVPPCSWERPGLGEWTVRELVGHAARTAFTTIDDYLVTELPADGAAATAPDGTDLLSDDDPVGVVAAYYLNTRDNAALHAGVAERGRQAAADMAADPLAAVRAMAERARSAVVGAPAGALFVSRFGAIGFAGYLTSRIVEIVVHGLDIAAATAVEFSPPPAAARLVVAVVAESARRRGQGTLVIRSLAGRGELPAGLNVFG